MKAEQLIREFKIGALLVQDPSPNTSPEKAIEKLSELYPHIKNGVVANERVEGGKIIYEVSIPPVKTNG